MGLFFISDWLNGFFVWILLSVYPKVKVREDKEYEDQFDLETRSLQSLKGLQSLCLDDFSSPGKSSFHGF